MGNLAEIYSAEWLQHDGAKVKVDGLKCRLSVRVDKAYYPYEREEITVYAEPISRTSKAYRAKTAELGFRDHWCTDVLSNLDLQCEILRQLGVE